MIVVLAAKYIEREALEDFLGDLFADGQAAYKRGHFQCELPRRLTPKEMESLKGSVVFTHYAEW
ncbi:hypothetical protein GQ44DRAFT_772133 [Phaeosphaeriaceae sp. PMI808]|nr:hypothetical protein GQ44DRAFT_772133 [Phaeosphaeriaceae sp. PMI808]